MGGPDRAGSGAIRQRGPWRNPRRTSVQQGIPSQAGVPVAALRVQDPQLGRRPGGPWRLLATVTVLCCPTTSRPSRIQLVRASSSLSPLASCSAPRNPDLIVVGSTTSSSAPARLASAASRPGRSPARDPVSAGSQPSGRSITSTSTVRVESSEAARDSASSRSDGVSTTSHSRRTPRATASTASKARARSSQAAIEPAACAWATARNATVVLPDDASPRSATVPTRGIPPIPSTASSAANPEDTTRSSASGARLSTLGLPAGVMGVSAGAVGSSAGSPGIATRASEPSTSGSTPRRGAAAPQRDWSRERASETSDERVIGRPIIEHPFYSSRARPSRPRSPCDGETGSPAAG